MKLYGRTTVSEFLGDRVVYRNLQPLDRDLPSLADLRAELGLPPNFIPRKSQEDYAHVIVRLLKAARAIEAPGTEIRQLIFVGDTRMNDATAFANLCRAGGWAGLAFIAAEDREPVKVELVAAPGSAERVYLSNRWAALNGAGDWSGDLPPFRRFCLEQGFPIDAATAVVVDLDKTAIGARGRNAHTIDAARVQAVRETVADLLGSAFDADAFRASYQEINRQEYHPFTADNQDYVAYICLILGSGLYDLDTVTTGAKAGQWADFQAFMQAVEARKSELSPALESIHTDLYRRVQAGDPTPFKAFRRNEYRVTVGSMGFLDDDQPVEQMLREEIVITQEVRQQALEWKAQGALLFGLSDKPDEASVPTEDQASQGFQPIHRTETHVVGE